MNFELLGPIALLIALASLAILGAAGAISAPLRMEEPDDYEGADHD